MPILSTDIKYCLSGGATNQLPAASLGGVKSSYYVTPETIFDAVSGAESAAGDIEYRILYIQNAHATLSLDNAVAWLQANTPSATTTVDIGLGTSALNGTEQTIADESTAPAGVTFIAASSKGAGIALGSIPAGQHRAIHLRRTINAGTVAVNDTFTVRAEGETAA